ncbi:hypothetical protein QL285_083535 [Trifolium repens]|nr:hypothetical protein QL285_083535 [Trifolium repens]
MLNTSMSGKHALLETPARKKTQFRILGYGKKAHFEKKFKVSARRICNTHLFENAPNLYSKMRKCLVIFVVKSCSKTSFLCVYSHKSQFRILEYEKC